MATFMQNPFATELFAIFIYMTVLFGIAMLIRRNDIVDIAWGVGFVLVALIGADLSSALEPRQLLILAMVVIWAARLSLYIFIRNKGRGEDARYKQWRHSWGKWFVLRSFLQIFMLQGLLLFIISFPISFTMQSERTSIGAFEIIGALVFFFGLIFEAIADQEKSVFKRNPANHGKLLTSGLWKYSRHPNYFGEVTLWWGFYIFALGDKQAWWTIVSPALITFLILKVSGIPMLETSYEGRADFEDYKRKTNAFIPGPRRS